MHIKEIGIAAVLVFLSAGLGGCDDAKPLPEKQTAVKASDRDLVRYESDKCSRPANGKVYVQIGVDIYGFDQEWPIILGGPSNFPTLRGVQETEPEGCPSNPIRTSVVRFAFRYEALRDDKANPRPRMDLQGMGLLERARSGGEYGGWVMAKSDWERTQNNGECHQENSIEICAYLTSSGREYSAARVAKEVYSTPQGEDFLMSCARGGYAGCGNAYALNATSALYYNFHKDSKTFEDILEFDKDLRQFLSESICRDCLNNHGD